MRIRKRRDDTWGCCERHPKPKRFKDKWHKLFQLENVVFMSPPQDPQTYFGFQFTTPMEGMEIRWAAIVIPKEENTNV